MKSKQSFCSGLTLSQTHTHIQYTYCIYMNGTHIIHINFSNFTRNLHVTPYAFAKISKTCGKREINSARDQKHFANV